MRFTFFNIAVLLSYTQAVKLEHDFEDAIQQHENLGETFSYDDNTANLAASTDSQVDIVSALNAVTEALENATTQAQ